MISAVLLINQKGEVVISRLYRDDVDASTANAFRMKVIAAKEASGQAPIKLLDGSSFLYVRHKDMYFVAITKNNVNPAMVFQFLTAMLIIFKAYFGEEFEEDAVRNNFTLVYELLDETLDFGYPQSTALEVLQAFINLGEAKTPVTLAKSKEMSRMITGALDWRREGIRYRKNEVFIDVLESVNLLLSSTGTVLRADVTGVVNMKTFLTGMPECKFGLNDKILMDRDAGGGGGGGGGAGRKRGAPAVEIDDISFHRCVRLRTFDSDRTITFVPPDGEFELMRYRITDNVNLPFRLIPVVEERGDTTVVLNIKVIGNFSSKLIATNVVIKVPTPTTTARAHINVGAGRAKYEPEQKAIVWRIRKFPGGAEYVMRGDVELITATRAKAWVRPPIIVEFQVPMFTASGLHVRSLKVFEKTPYPTTKWVRYITRAGTYQIRIGSSRED